jgi:hypothetical protein
MRLLHSICNMPLPFYGDPAARLLKCYCGGSGTYVMQHNEKDDDIVITHPLEVSSLSRHLQFAAAAYGAKSLKKFMGVCDSLSYIGLAMKVPCICQLCGILATTKRYLVATSWHGNDTNCMLLLILWQWITRINK